MDFVIIASHGSQCEHFSEPLHRNITEDLLSPGCDFIIFNWCLCSLPGLQQNLLFRLCCQQLFSSREHETSISIAALTMTGSAWCSPATDGSAVEEITNGWCGRLRTATFAAACRISTCCEMSCAQAFRGDCVENHGTLVRASAATWYVRYCRNVRTHALHDSNFRHWANRGDDFASLHTQQFDKLSEMTYRRSQVFYAMPGWSVSKTRFTVFQEYTKWQTLSKPWICSLLAHKLADTTCKSMKIYCTSGSTSIHTRWSHDWSGTCMFLNCSVKTMHPLTVCHAF